MPSAGEGAARGLESGFRLAMDFHDRQRRAEREARQDQRQATLDQRATEDHALARQRQQQQDDLRILDQQQAMLDAEGKAYAEFTPENRVKREWIKRNEAIKQARQGVLSGQRNSYDPTVPTQRAQAGMEALKAGRLDYFSQNPGVFTETVELTGFTPVEYQPGGVVEQGAKALTQGLETGDQDMVIKGANVVFRPELSKGIGERGAQGGTIVGKRIVNMVPDPNDPQRVIPTMRVYVNNGKPEDSGDEIRTRRGMDPDAPRGATGYYEAPLTQNRSADPNDLVKSVSIKEALDKVGQHMQMVQMMGTPEAQQLVQLDSTAVWDENKWDTALAERGLHRPKPKTEVTKLRADEVEIRRKVDKDGNVIPGSEQRLEGNERGARTYKPGASQEKVDTIKRMVAEGILTEDEGRARLRTLSTTLAQPTAASLANAPGGAKDREQARKELKDRFDRADKNADNAEQAVRDVQAQIKDHDAVKRYGAAKRDPAVKAKRDELVAKLTTLEGEAKKARARASSLSADLDRLVESQQPAPERVASGAAPKRPGITKAEFDALPPGATFIAPDGTRRRKPGP